LWQLREKTGCRAGAALRARRQSFSTCFAIALAIPIGAEIQSKTI